MLRTIKPARDQGVRPHQVQVRWIAEIKDLEITGVGHVNFVTGNINPPAFSNVPITSQSVARAGDGDAAGGGKENA